MDYESDISAMINESFLPFFFITYHRNKSSCYSHRSYTGKQELYLLLPSSSPNKLNLCWKKMIYLCHSQSWEKNKTSSFFIKVLYPLKWFFIKNYLEQSFYSKLSTFFKFPEEMWKKNNCFYSFRNRLRIKMSQKCLLDFFFNNYPGKPNH